jgi:SNF2 family DNA or RNA helicase
VLSINIFCNARKLQNRIVTKMHEILRPFVLRRLKREVLGDKLPPKVHYNLWMLCA